MWRRSIPWGNLKMKNLPGESPIWVLADTRSLKPFGKKKAQLGLGWWVFTVFAKRGFWVVFGLSKISPKV